MVTFIDFIQSATHLIEKGLGNHTFLLVITCSLFILKSSLLFLLISRGFRSSKINLPWIFLILVLTGALFENIAWIVKLLQLTILPSIDKRIVLFVIRLAWAFAVVQYQAITLFIESLFEKHFTFTIRQKCFITISGVFFVLFAGIALSNIYNPFRVSFELKLIEAATLYTYFPLMLISLILTFKKIRKLLLPRILKKQLSVLLRVLIVPWWLCDILQLWPFNFTPGYIASSYAAIGISNMLLTYVIYYSARRVVGLRFLNFKNHVQGPVKYNFIDNFKELLEQLSQATNIAELNHITQTYFKTAFNLPLRSTTLYVRSALPQQTQERTEGIQQQSHKKEKLQADIESFLTTSKESITEALKDAKILIYDEIAFNTFYHDDRLQKQLLTFLDAINADIFLPIYEKQQLIAYIVIDRNARHDQFYNNTERDEMIVFVSYLSNVIHLLQNRNLEELIYQEKELKEELYSKHQEINQYKESIRSFLHTNPEKQIGILFYKSRRFIYGNQAARELVDVNINVKTGHPVTKALKRMALQVIDYKAPQTHFTKDAHGNQLVLNGVLNTEKNNVIISVYRPEISDIITKQVNQLKDPSKWDYLLYLETTRSGRLINQLIPGSGETLLTFKISLLKAALSKKATLLDMPEEDVIPTAELLHHVSLRDSMHTLTLTAPERSGEITTKLFGMNPLFISGNNTEKALLKKLHPNGTLFIQNIQYLSLETQKQLAEFIRYGFYRAYKSEQKQIASVRVICSSNQNLNPLVHDGYFSHALFNELKKTTLAMPSLLTLPKHELGNLADGFSEQAIKTQTFKSLLTLSPKDKGKLTEKRPVSLQELKTRVQQLLVEKSKKNDVYYETQFDPAYEINDPELAEVARLGKHALRDPKTMALLWDKFKNQNKIAAFLGVNRSSVNRRCRKYNLI